MSTPAWACGDLSAELRDLLARGCSARMAPAAVAALTDHPAFVPCADELARSWFKDGRWQEREQGPWLLSRAFAALGPLLLGGTLDRTHPICRAAGKDRVLYGLDVFQPEQVGAAGTVSIFLTCASRSPDGSWSIGKGYWSASRDDLTAQRVRAWVRDEVMECARNDMDVWRETRILVGTPMTFDDGQTVDGQWLLTGALQERRCRALLQTVGVDYALLSTVQVPPLGGRALEMMEVLPAELALLAWPAMRLPDSLAINSPDALVRGLLAAVNLAAQRGEDARPAITQALLDRARAMGEAAWRPVAAKLESWKHDGRTERRLPAVMARPRGP